MISTHVQPSLAAKTRRQRGQNLIEFAIVLPVFLLLVLAILDFGRVVYASHVVTNCAREAARFGKAHPGDPAAIISVAEQTAVGLDRSLIIASVSYPTESTLRVDVDYDFRLITPLIAGVIGQDSIMLHGVSTMYLGY
jgi:hypothetical protein